LVVAAALALLVLASVLSGSRTAVRAQDGGAGPPSDSIATGLDITVRAGLGKLEVSYWSGYWSPFRITITNQGPSISGKLVVRCPSSDGPNPKYRDYVKEVRIPTASRQTHEVTAFVSSAEDPHIQVIVGDQVIADTSVKVDRTYGLENQLDVIVVDNEQSALSGIASVNVERVPNRPPFGKAGAAPDTDVDRAAQQNPQRRFRNPLYGMNQGLQAHPVVIAPDDLPRDYIGYDRVDALVLGEAPLSQLSEEQSRALRLWVASGGLLVVTGAADFAGLRSSGLLSILPVEPHGSATRPASAVSELNGVYGAFETADPVLVTDSSLTERARSLIGAGQNLVIAERNYGAGLVRFLGFNPKLYPYRGWIGEKQVWADLLLPAAQSKPHHTNWITAGRRGPNASRWGVQGLLFKLAQISPPSPVYILLFLLCYVIGVGPLNYLALRWKRRTDLAWLTIPAVVLLFTAISVAVAQRSRGSSAVLADVSLVELHQRDGLAHVTGGLLVVPSSKGTQKLSVLGRDAFANDVFQGANSGSAAGNASIEAERDQQQFNLRIPMTTWASTLFQIRSLAEGAKPLVSFEQASSGGTLTNVAGTEITKAVLLSRDGVSDIFDLSTGGTQAITMNAAQPGSFNTWYSSQLGGGSEEADLFQEVAAILDKEIGGEPAFSGGFFDKNSMIDSMKQLERPLLVCFVARSPNEVDFQGASRRRSKALYVVHL